MDLAELALPQEFDPLEAAIGQSGGPVCQTFNGVRGHNDGLSHFGANWLHIALGRINEGNCLRARCCKYLTVFLTSCADVFERAVGPLYWLEGKSLVNFFREILLIKIKTYYFLFWFLITSEHFIGQLTVFGLFLLAFYFVGAGNVGAHANMAITHWLSLLLLFIVASAAFGCGRRCWDL